LFTTFTAREICKETLLRKVSEADAHVVSFGMKVGGLRSSDTSQGFIDKLEPAKAGFFF